MAMTCSASAPSGGKSTITGTGYAGTEIVLSIGFTATDNKRRYIEAYRIPVVAGAINYDVPVAFTSGTVVIKATDNTGAVLFSASNLSV
jgi:hypothetical protein